MKTNQTTRRPRAFEAFDGFSPSNSFRAAIGRCSAFLLIAAGIESLAFAPLHAATTAKVVPDSSITAAVEDGLVFDRSAFSADVSVSTSQGIVTLSGSTDNILEKERAVKIAESIKGVRGVVDQTTVTPVSRSDEEIRKDILMALLQDPATESYQVTVSVRDAVATLSGGVGSFAESGLAARIAKGIKGVKEVHNEIGISYLAKRTDAQIANDIKNRLQWDIWINGDFIEPAVKDGKATLTGTVGSALGKSRAVDDAWVIGVTAVDGDGVKIESWAGNSGQRKSKETVRSDPEMKQAIEAALHLDPRVSAFSPEVNVEGGVIILGGAVGNLKAKNAAEQDAKNIVGVWRVDNNLKVRPNVRPTNSEMEQQLKAALLWDSLLDSSAIDVAVIKNVAYLSGTVDSVFEKTEAQDVASRIKGVALIRNHLKVEPEFAATYYDWPYYSYDGWSSYNRPPYSVAEAFWPRAYLSDEQIKKNIERSFFWSPFVDSDNITVTVHGAVATLSGTVGTWIGWGEADKDAHKSGATDVLNQVKVK